MYQVYCGNRLILETGEQDLPITTASLSLEIGKTGSLEFTIYPAHPNYSAVVPMAIVLVSRKYETIFEGRVLGIKYGLYNEKKVSCEGDLAFLLDAMIPPHNYSGSFSEYLPYIVDLYNSQVDSDRRFVSGSVTVGDFYPFTVEEKEYITALDALQTKMASRSGGYLRIRHESGYKYIDLVSEYGDASNISGQSITLGENLLDITREFAGENVFSAIIPLGAKDSDTGERLNIKSVNGGKSYIENAAAKELCGGMIYRKVVFDNITNAQTLKTEAETYLANNYAGENSVEVTAADLSGVNPSLDFFRVGQWVRVYSYSHFTDNPQLFLIKKMTVDLINPAQNKIVIGRVKKGLSEEMAGLSNSVGSISVPDAVHPYVIESGTTGIWKWSKFSDNTCEFFGKIPITNADVSIALGAWYRGANLYEAETYEYPLQMTEAPALEMMFQTRNGLGAMLWVFSQSAEVARQYVPQCYLVRPTTGTGIYGNINIIGKGKL